MDESELLLTVAEISVAFAGFASLASVFGRRSGQDDARVDSGRLLNMLTTNLTVTVLALAPFIPMLIGLPDRWVWGTGGVVGIIAIVSFGPAILRRTALMKQYAGFNTARSYWNYALTAVAVVALLGCIFGVPSEKLFATYFSGLLALLAVSGSLFFSVIASLARTPE
jgi:hypothetical protein